MQFLEQEDTKVSNKLFGYAKMWKQPINISKSVYQLFHTQVTLCPLSVLMDNIPLECVNDFKYLGYTWTSKLSMRKLVANCLEKVRRSYTKLKWLKRSRVVSTSVLRQCFFAYSFPFFAWLFCFFPFLPSSHHELLRQKFRADLRLVHRCPWIAAHELHTFTNEKDIDYYIKEYIKKRLKKIYKFDLPTSLFFNDISFWSDFKKRKKDELGHYFRQKRVKQMLKKHKSLLGIWLEYTENK